MLYWKTTGILLGNRRKVDPVKIRSIEITGGTLVRADLFSASQVVFFVILNQKKGEQLLPLQASRTRPSATSAVPGFTRREIRQTGARSVLPTR